MKLEIELEMLDDIQHVCTWYQGREPERAVKLEKWIEEVKAEHHGLIAIKKAMEHFRQQQIEWLAQFKKGDIWKPKRGGWKCKKRGQKWCEYEPFDDPACDGCIHCHQPYERK